MLPTKFQVNWLLGLGEEAKKRFSRWLPWRPSWISDLQDLSYFWSTSHPNTSYQVWSQLAFRLRKWSGKKPWQPSWISDRNNFSYFWSTSHPNASYRVNWHLSLGEEAKNRFWRWPPWRPSWIYDRHDFSYFWSTSHPNASYQVSSQLAFRCRRRSEKIDFQDGSHGGHLGYPIGTILAIFDLQVTLMLPTKFRVNWLLGLGEEAKNRYLRWLQWRPFWIYDRHDFGYFWSISHPDAF